MKVLGTDFANAIKGIFEKEPIRNNLTLCDVFNIIYTDKYI